MPCTETYCGSSPASELETQVVQDEALRIETITDIEAWITIHTYGRMWMFPFGNTINHEGETCERPDDHDEMVSGLDNYRHILPSTVSNNYDGPSSLGKARSRKRAGLDQRRCDGPTNGKLAIYTPTTTGIKGDVYLEPNFSVTVNFLFIPLPSDACSRTDS